MSEEISEIGQLPWTGERYLPEIPGDIELEHVHRYTIARDLAYGKDVLDIACGEGYGSELLATVARKVTGVDVSEEAIAHASRKYTRPNISFAVGSCACIPLPDASVDLVVSFETIEHHDQHLEMMKEIRRVLRPEGAVIISSPDKHEYSDVPGYRNEYHVKELYLSEFTDLLASEFQNVKVFGQRVYFGSLVAPMDGAATRFASYSRRDGNVRREPGLMKPIYYIAVASNTELPEIHGGLYEGGAYLGSQFAARDGQIAALHQAVAERDAQVVALSQAATERDAQMVSLHYAVAERDAQLSTLSQAATERDAQIGALDRAVVERDAQVAALNQAITESNGQIANYKEAVAQRDAQMTALLRAAKERDAEIDALRLELERAEHAKGGIATTVREREALIAAATKDLGQIKEQIARMEATVSWRVTAPLRAVRRRLAKLRPRYRARALLSRAARFSYRWMPLSTESRIRLKSFLFSNFSPLFRNTVAYKAWKAHTAQPVAVCGCVPAIAEALFSDSRDEYVPMVQSPIPPSEIKLIAFYLPQFHPIPENDEWWGKGFTEWTNVTRAKPQFVGHYQPHLPGELGFYDLRLIEVQQRQIELARAYGIHGFCYHHYWFGGRRLLERPFNQVLANKQLDLPFCLCWANENWTRRWDGHDQEILIAQSHSPEDDLAFIKDIDPALRDDRYIRICGRPLLIVYRPGLLPDARATAQRWREYCRSAGIGEIYLASTYAFDSGDPRDIDFDAAIEFPPNNSTPPVVTGELRLLNPKFQGVALDYKYFVERSRNYVKSPYRLFRTVFPSWDNEARKPGRGTTVVNTSPQCYREWLDNACRWASENLPREERLVFLNAWNEWAEGCHLEPDRRYGYAWLQATRDALERHPGATTRKIVYVSHDAQFNGAQLLSLHVVQALRTQLGYQVTVLLLEGGPLAGDFARHARVYDFSSPEFTGERQLEVLGELFESGVRAAITSTVVAGSLAERLRSRGFRVVSLVHELPGLIRQHNLEGALESISRAADIVVFPAQEVAAKVSALCPIAPEKIVVRPQGLFHRNTFKTREIEARRLVRAEFGLPQDARIVLGMGYGDRRKGIDLFLKTALRVIEETANTYFMWVGTWDPNVFQPLETRVRGPGGRKRILLPGNRPDPDAYFSGADAFFLASREDPFPSVVLAAMDTGLPVVAFDGAGGFCELLQDGAGLLVPHGDPSAAANALTRLLADGSLRDSISAKARRVVATRFEFLDYVYDLASYAGEHCPKVSAIIPNYNYERYLSQRLMSVVGQTYRPYEILFLDDCSTDGSIAVAERILEASGIPYRIVRNAKNVGTFQQWMRGISEARGELIWIAEADDYCDERLLDTLVSAFRDSKVALAHCQSQQVDESGNQLAPDYLDYTNDLSPTKWRSAYVREGIEEIRDTLAIKNTIPNVSAVVMSKPDVVKLQSLQSELTVAGDWLTYVHLLEHGKIAYFPEALNCHRRHSRGVTLGSEGVKLLKEIRALQQFVATRFQVSDAVRTQADNYLQFVYEHFGLHKSGVARFRQHPALRDMEGIGVAPLHSASLAKNI